MWFINTICVQDNHLYYTSRFIPPGRESDSLWFELSDIEGSGDIVTNISEAAIQDYFRYYQVNYIVKCDSHDFFLNMYTLHCLHAVDMEA